MFLGNLLLKFLSPLSPLFPSSSLGGFTNSILPLLHYPPSAHLLPYLPVDDIIDDSMPVICAPEQTCKGLFGWLDVGFQCPTNTSCRATYDIAADDDSERRQLRGGFADSDSVKYQVM